MFMYDLPKALKTPNKQTTCPRASNPQKSPPPNPSKTTPQPKCTVSKP